MFHCAKVYIKLLLFYIQENYGCMQKDVLMDPSMFFSGKTNFTAFDMRLEETPFKELQNRVQVAPQQG